ncbi:MAG: hypothetical protein ACKVE4_05085 [Dissulfuribacterales bacterium]
MLRSYSIVDESKKVYPLAKFETSKPVPCGEKQPAADEKLIIESKQKTFYMVARTDSDGAIELKKVLKMAKKA